MSGLPEGGGAFGGPGEGLGPDLACPAGAEALGRVVEDPIFSAIGRGHEAGVAGGEDAIAGLEGWLGVFGPGGGVGQVSADFGGQEAEAVVVGPASAGGVGEEDAAVADEGFGTLVDEGVADGFPGEFGAGDSHAGTGEGCGAGHGGDVEVLLDVDVSLPSRPDKVALAGGLEDGAIDGPPVGGRVGELAFEVEGTEEGVGGPVLQDVHAVVFVLAVIGGEVDVPGAVEVVQLGSPDFPAVGAGGGGAPDDAGLTPGQAGQGLRPFQDD